MAPGWFAPPNPHALRPQQGPQPGGGRFHPGPGQRMPPGSGGGMNGGVNSPHTHNYHQRSSPPMRGPYPGHGHVGGPRQHGPPPPPHGVLGHPHGARMPPQGGRFQMQHPSGLVVGGPRPMPPSAGGHNHMARHHAPSPGMPPRMQIHPPNAMRPIPQQGGPGGPRPPSFEHPIMQQHSQHGPPRGMHQHQQHMMRLQQEQMHQQRPGFHSHHHHHHLSSMPMGHADHPVQRQASEDSENRMQQPYHFHTHPPPGTPEVRVSDNNGTSSRSPSPPPIPPPLHYHDQVHPGNSEGAQQRSSPSSSPGGEGSSEPPPLNSKTPSWNPAPGLGPLRESRLQNMPQPRLMVPLPQHVHHHHHPHAQRPIPQHINSNANAYINENMERFRAMELKQHPSMKASHRHPPQQHQPPPLYHANVRPLVHSPGSQHHMSMQHQPPQPQQQKGEGNNSKKGPDITMDAASMLLALRTSASPSTVSAAPLEEQASRDQSEVSKKTNTTDQQEHDYLEDDDVPALQSSSSSLSVPHTTKPMVQHHEVPKNFPTRLALPNDEAKLNSLHCFLRSELLEIFVVEKSANKSPTHSPGSSVGRVGLRCVFCAMVRKRHSISATAEHDLTANTAHPRCDEAPMAVFYPKSIAEIYRLVTSWQRCHLRKCRNLPPQIRNKWTMLRENDKSRGKTHYWITSAKEIGLIDCNSRAGGIRFAFPRSSSPTSGTIITTASGVADNDSICEAPSYNQGRENEGLSEVYQPHSNPNFTEGPSQKHREAVSQDVESTTVPVIDSPLKQEVASEQMNKTQTPEKQGKGSDSIHVAPVESDIPCPPPVLEATTEVTESTQLSAVTV